jgi:tRNA-2-methylthio-N6-dimethylallyladenosine synthase
MKIKSDWILPDLKAAQKRTKKAVPYINHFELEDYVRYIGKGKKYYISTFGCQANQRDSETLAGILDAMNFEPSESPEKADVVLINTCAVRQNAEEKVLGEVGNLKRVYRENKDLVIGVCGCMAQ